METLEVTPSQLRAAAQKLKDAATGIADELESLEDAADQLRLAWDGDAQNAFDTAQTRLRVRMDTHKKQLLAIANAVSALADGYGQTDRSAARGLGGQ